MYQIEKTSYGFKLTFSGFIKADEMKKWVEESKNELDTVSGDFGVFVDMRELKPLDDHSKRYMEDGQALYKKHGMERSVVIVNTSILKLQFRGLAKDSGIYQWERYIDSSEDIQWENIAIDWLVKGIDPDR